VQSYNIYFAVANISSKKARTFARNSCVLTFHPTPLIIG